MTTSDDLGTWEPLAPHEIGAVFRDYPGRWCIAGGWALDLFAAIRSRPHDDIDILILRDDLPLLHDALPGWDLSAAHGILTPWAKGAPFPADAHDIWCQRSLRPDDDKRTPVERPWMFQLMTVETDGGDWLFRRDHRIRGALATMTLEREGLPILAPEIQLLYKSKRPNRPKDEQDFAHTAPRLSPAQRTWLGHTLALLYGVHPWLQTLASLAPPS